MGRNEDITTNTSSVELTTQSATQRSAARAVDISITSLKQKIAYYNKHKGGLRSVLGRQADMAALIQFVNAFPDSEDKDEPRFLDEQQRFALVCIVARSKTKAGHLSDDVFSLLKRDFGEHYKLLQQLENLGQLSFYQANIICSDPIEKAKDTLLILTTLRKYMTVESIDLFERDINYLHELITKILPWILHLYADGLDAICKILANKELASLLKSALDLKNQATRNNLAFALTTLNICSDKDNPTKPYFHEKNVDCIIKAIIQHPLEAFYLMNTLFTMAHFYSSDNNASTQASFNLICNALCRQPKHAKHAFTILKWMHRYYVDEIANLNQLFACIDHFELILNNKTDKDNTSLTERTESEIVDRHMKKLLFVYIENRNPMLVLDDINLLTHEIHRYVPLSETVYRNRKTGGLRKVKQAKILDVDESLQLHEYMEKNSVITPEITKFICADIFNLSINLANTKMKTTYHSSARNHFFTPLDLRTCSKQELDRLFPAFWEDKTNVDNTEQTTPQTIHPKSPKG